MVNIYNLRLSCFFKPHLHFYQTFQKPEAVAFPRNSLRNITIICKGMLKAGNTNLDKIKDILPDIRTGKVRKPESDYKFLTRFFDQGKISNQGDAAQ